MSFDHGHESRESVPCVTVGNLRDGLTLLLMALVAGLVPQRRWSDVSRVLALLHRRARGASEAYRHAVSALNLPQTAGELEHAYLTGVYEDIIYTMRENLPGGWSSDIRLHGREHLDEALALGRGAVLWVCPTTHGGLVIIKALHRANAPAVFLRSVAHPYSGTRFGKRFLNPVRTRIEDRWIGIVPLVPGGETSATKLLSDHLTQNRVVAMAAIGSGRRPLAVPFLGGELSLALGAPRLALKTGAALLPIFATPTNDGAFEVTIEAPLSAADASGHALDPVPLAHAYARRLEAYVARYPSEWRGWTRQWTPHRCDGDRRGI